MKTYTRRRNRKVATKRRNTKKNFQRGGKGDKSTSKLKGIRNLFKFMTKKKNLLHLLN